MCRSKIPSLYFTSGLSRQLFAIKRCIIYTPHVLNHTIPKKNHQLSVPTNLSHFIFSTVFVDIPSKNGSLLSISTTK